MSPFSLKSCLGRPARPVLKKATAFLLLISPLAAVLTGCATSGVSSQLRPYHQLASGTESELSQEVTNAVETLLADMYVPVASGSQALCRTKDGYFIVKTTSSGIETRDAIYIGNDPAQAVQSVMEMRHVIKAQQSAARAQMLQAIAVGLAVAAQNASSYTTPQPGSSVSIYPYLIPPPAARPSMASEPESDPQQVVNVFGANGKRIGYGLQSGSENEVIPVFNTQGKYSGFVLPSGSADGVAPVFNTQGKYSGFARP